MLGNDTRTVPKTSLAQRAGSTLVVLIIFGILGRVLYLNLETLRFYEWHFRFGLLFASFLPLSFNYLIAAYVWTGILRMLGQSMSFSESFRITYLSASGKYIPGRIWTYVGRVYLAARAGLPRRLTLASMALMFVIYNGIAIFFFLCTVLLWESVPAALALSSILLFSLFLSLLLHPKVLARAVNLCLRLFNKEKLEFVASHRSILSLLGLLILDRIIFSAFAYLFVNSFMNLGLVAAVKFSGIFSIAVLLGMLAFMVPAGLGVREGVQTYLLGSFLPVSTAILIPLALRVCMTLGELICFSIALKIRKAEVPPRSASAGECQAVQCKPGHPGHKGEVLKEPV